MSWKDMRVKERKEYVDKRIYSILKEMLDKYNKEYYDEIDMETFENDIKYFERSKANAINSLSLKDRAFHINRIRAEARKTIDRYKKLRREQFSVSLKEIMYEAIEALNEKF